MQADLNKTQPEISDSPLFIEVAPLADLPPGKMKPFMLPQGPLVLVNIEGEVFAFADYCMHWGVRLSDGCLEGHVVRCRAHGWNHDIAKGEVIESEPAGDTGRRMITFDTKIAGGTVWVSTARKKRGETPHPGGSN